MNKRVKEIWNRIWFDIRHYAWIVAVIVFYYLLVRTIWGAYCPLLIVTGFPCAGCGLTRATLYALHGEFARSFFLNPMAIPIILCVLYAGICRYIIGCRVKGGKALIVLGVFVLIGIYIIRMYLFFPNRVPYVYSTHNVCATYVPHYAEFVQNLIREITKLRL